MSDCSPMVHVWKASGDQMATLALADVGSVRTLKQHLQTLCGVSRFRQRLLLRGETLADEAQLASSPSGALDVQLVLLPFVSTSVWEVHDLTSRVATGSERQVEEILLRPQDPNLFGHLGEHDAPDRGVPAQSASNGPTPLGGRRRRKLHRRSRQNSAEHRVRVCWDRDGGDSFECQS